MSHLLLTTTRGDRPKMLDQCKAQVKRFVTSFGIHCIVDYPPEKKGFDLTERVRYGYESALEHGVDWVVMIEDDDAYNKDYLHKVLTVSDQSDFIGCEFSYYYNVKLRTWERLYHPNRSSLFTTAFRVSAMKDFKWHLAHKLFLDIDIWRHARKYRSSFLDAGAVGIKGHESGLTGGAGHKMHLKNADPDLRWLSSKVDQESLEFYKSFGE